MFRHAGKLPEMFAGWRPRPVWLFKAEQELKAHFHVLSLYLVSKPHFLEPSRKWRSAGGERARVPAMPGMWRNLPHPDEGREHSISPPGGSQQIVQSLGNTEHFLVRRT